MEIYIQIRGDFSLRGNSFYALLLCTSTYTLIKCLVEIYSCTINAGNSNQITKKNTVYYSRNKQMINKLVIKTINKDYKSVNNIEAA